MKNEYTAGQLVKMGKFREAIRLFNIELELAFNSKKFKQSELLKLVELFNTILLNPSDFELVQLVGDKMLQMEMRIPNYLTPVSKEEYYENIKLNYETINPNDQ